MRLTCVGRCRLQGGAEEAKSERKRSRVAGPLRLIYFSVVCPGGLGCGTVSGCGDSRHLRHRLKKHDIFAQSQVKRHRANGCPIICYASAVSLNEADAEITFDPRDLECG